MFTTLGAAAVNIELMSSSFGSNGVGADIRDGSARAGGTDEVV